MLAFVPGASRHGCSGSFAVVQPQDGTRLLMTTSSGERFVKLQVKLADNSPTFASYSFISASQFNPPGGIGVVIAGAGRGTWGKDGTRVMGAVDDFGC